MADVTKDDLRDLRQALTEIVRDEAAQTRAALQDIDQRARDTAETVARHSERIEILAQSDRDQWSEIGTLRSGRGSSAAPTTRMTKREYGQIGGALVVIGGVAEGIHQLVRLLVDVFKR